MSDRTKIRWNPEIPLSAPEEAICKRCKRNGRLFSFLRRHRHELFDEEFQRELTIMYKDSPLGQPPTPPALLGLVTILQAATGLSDAAAVEEAVFDRRWQMVLDCLGTEKPPFSQGSLVDFRRRLLEHGLHRRFVERSVELARATGGFGHTKLRVALDSAPLWGAGRVEDTFNLIGHALEIVVRCAAVAAGLSADEVRTRSGVKLLGGTSIKAALDIDWDDKDEQRRALQRLLGDVSALRGWIEQELPNHAHQPGLREALEQLRKVIEQDLEPDPEPLDGMEPDAMRITKGTAKDRQLSIHDKEMRHGRKSRSQLIKGYKRFIAVELGTGLIVGTAIQPANQPERDATEQLKSQISHYGELEELHIDRGFLASKWVEEINDAGKRVACRPWPIRNSGRYTKEDFSLKLDKKTATCPAGVSTKIRKGLARFPASACDGCGQRKACTTAKPGKGRTVSVHEQEELLVQLRARKKTPEGRAELRERVCVEHKLAHICNRQGRRARYIGVEKNEFDLCRYAVIENLFVADRAELLAA